MVLNALNLGFWKADQIMVSAMFYCPQLAAGLFPSNTKSLAALNHEKVQNAGFLQKMRQKLVSMIPIPNLLFCQAPYLGNFFLIF